MHFKSLLAVFFGLLVSLQALAGPASPGGKFTKLSEEVSRVVRIAWESGTVDDPEVAPVLKAMYEHIQASGVPFAQTDPATDYWCKHHPIGRIAAFADINHSPVLIHICMPQAKVLQQLTIHEFVHVIQSEKSKGFGPEEECLADMVSMWATGAASILRPDRVPPIWNQVGAYFAKCPAEQKDRYLKFISELNERVQRIDR